MALRPSCEALEERITLSVTRLTGLATIHGRSADAPLVNSQGVLYTTYVSSSNEKDVAGGVIKILPNGTVQQNFVTFHVSTEGYPSSNLVGDANGAMYGSVSGGVEGDGIFSVTASGTLSRIASIDDAQGKTGDGPGDLLLANGVLYGTCYGGGADNDGTVFSVPVGGGTPKLLGTFHGDNGIAPTGGLTLSNGILYGTTSYGGAHNSGTVFSIPAGGGFITKLADFDGGAVPNGHPVVHKGFVVGTTNEYHGYDSGSIWRVPVAGGNLFSWPLHHISTEGANARGGLIVYGDKIIGTTLLGGKEGVGTVFQINFDSFTISTLAFFPHHGNNGLGVFPFGTPTAGRGGTLFGVSRGPAGQGDDRLVFWKLSGLPGGQGAPKQLTAPKMFPPGRSTVVQDTEPVFHWTRVAGATSYDLLVTDITPGLRPTLANAVKEIGLTGTSFKPGYTLNPAHYFQVKVRASDGSQQSAWSNAPKFKIAEQKTRDYRIRLDKTFELSGGANFGRFVFTIQALTDSEGRDALGPPRIMIFRATGLTVPNPVPIGFSGVSTWDMDFRTPKKLSVDELDGGGNMTLYPSVSLGVSIFSTPTTLAFVKPNWKFTQNINVDSNGFGLTFLTAYVGVWSVLPAPHYDPDLWPNSVVP